MSAGVSEQRMKGQGNQVSNGPKEQLGAGEGASGSEEFEPWRSHQQNSAAHTPYGASVPISSATDIYNMGTAGMFGPSTTFSTPAFGQPSSFNYFHSNGDYNTWGSQLGGQRKYDEYYRDPQNMYPPAMADSALKRVEQGMQNLELKSSDGSKDCLGPKKTTWASIASQPAKPQLTVQNQALKKKGPGMPPGPIVPGKHNMDIGTWDTGKSAAPQLPIVNQNMPKAVNPGLTVRPIWNGPPTARPAAPSSAQRPGPPQHQHPLQSYQPPTIMPSHLPPPVTMPTSVHMQGIMPPAPIPLMVQQQQQQQQPAPTHPVLDELRVKNNYNPSEFDLMAQNARFFVIKSYSEDDIHRSIKYEIWCSTEHGNKRLDQAYREREGNGAVYLFFSVNGSGHFCGMAQMVSPLDYNSNSSVWSQDKWKGQFKVRWIYVKDVPNVQLRHIRLENNENKPVTNSRDTQEVPHSKGLMVLRIMHSYRHSTSIFDDFVHYEKRQEEEDNRKIPSSKDEQELTHREHHNRERDNHRSGGGSSRNHDHDNEKDSYRPSGYRHNDHHVPHHKDRGENSRGRGGKGGRN
ncbi:YTH domain-containing family protein 2 isoform X2 [Coccinella septempunctata]|uniref:YTH domain-containing family protein 2 isoform X2 n=1 Tax=Coccinella septempunctata TaxID=41139 RepID=UPI001D06CE96|nr:YTH domain-containing family protein 2 isoform X2 [Coccinella septempunctata]